MPKYLHRPISSLLPKDARDALVAASQLSNPRQRQQAVQEAIERAQRRYPHLFKTQPEGATQ